MAGCDPAALIVLDATSPPTALTPLRARRPRGTRAVGRVPRQRRPAVTLVATLPPAGVGPGVPFPGAVARQVCAVFVAQALAPRVQPGQTVVLDNRSAHQSPRAQQAIEAAGCRLRFLPTSAPDLNPIEQAFAKLKAALRRAEARTVAAIFAATEEADPTITPADTRNFYRASGYNL